MTYKYNCEYLDHLNEVDKENIFVLVTEAINVIVYHPSIMVNCKPGDDHYDDGSDNDLRYGLKKNTGLFENFS